MTKPQVIFTPSKPDLIVALSAIVLAFTAGIKLFMDHYVFPNAGGYVSIEIPSRASRDTSFFVDPSEFNAPSVIAIVVAALFTAAIFALARTNKRGALLLTFLANCMFALFYSMVILGNAFHELWGGEWSILGVAIAVVVIFGIEIIAFKSVTVERPGAPQV